MKTQVWIAIAVYVLVAIVKKRLNLQASLHTILHSSASPYSRNNRSISYLLKQTTRASHPDIANQLKLFPQISGH